MTLPASPITAGYGGMEDHGSFRASPSIPTETPLTTVVGDA